MLSYMIMEQVKSLKELHWNVAIAIFILVLALSFFLQTILIEKENKNDLRLKVDHSLNQAHKNYSKEKNKQSDSSISNHNAENEKGSDKLQDIIEFFGQENNHYLYLLYRQIQNLLLRKEKELQLSDEEKELQLSDDRESVEKELIEFHIPEKLLDHFVDMKIRRDGLALESYILPLSFFLFIYFSAFLVILPLINSIFVSNSNQIIIPIFSIFPNETDTTPTIAKTGIPLLVIQWGFLGGLVYTSISLLSRFLRKDLPPRVYYNASFRLLLSGAGAVIVFFLYMIINNGKDEYLKTTSFVLLLCFSVGIAPIPFLIRTADIILSKAMKSWRHKDTAGKRGLINIEGIDSVIAERLSEEGLDYIQQLALCDPIDISIKTKFPLPIVKDWKDQALLYLLTADIIVKKNGQEQHLNDTLNKVYGIRRFGQFYHLTSNLIKNNIHGEEKNEIKNGEKELQDFCKELGLNDDPDKSRSRYLIESIITAGSPIYDIYYK